MYGWRARLGLILPMDNAVLEPELYSLALPGVAAYGVRLLTTDRLQMPDAGVEVSSVFNELGVDAIGYACAETSFLGGVDTNVRVRDGIEAATGSSAVTAIGAMTEALDALGVGSVAIAAPYRASSAAALETYLGNAGLSVTSVVSRDFSTTSTDEREWYETNIQPPTTAYAMARRADGADAEAVVIAATNIRTFEVIAALEADLGKPVISTNTALLWALLQRCGVAPENVPLGRLWGTMMTGSAPDAGPTRDDAEQERS